MSNRELFDYLTLAADLARHERDMLLLESKAQSCAHYCRNGRHLLMVHPINDAEGCDNIERALERGRLQCGECDWALGSDYTER